MKRTGRFFIAILFLTAAVCGETAYLKAYHSQSAEDIRIKKDYVAVSGVFLPAFYSESPFIRHSTFSDISSVFPHDPFMLDASLGSIMYGRLIQ